MKSVTVEFGCPCGGPIDVNNIGQVLQFHRSIHALVRPRALGKFPVESYIDCHRSVHRCWIDANHMTRNQTVMRIDRSRLPDQNVFRFGLSDLE